MQNLVKKVMYILNDTTLGGAVNSLIDTLSEIRKYITPVVVMPKAAKAKIYFEKFNICCYEADFVVDYVRSGKINSDMQAADLKQGYEMALWLLPIIEKEKIQMIHINSSTSWFGAVAALMAKIPYVWHIRELMEEQFRCEFINDQLKRELYARADLLIAISDYVRTQYYEKYSVDTKRVYNGIDVQKYKISLSKDKEFAPVFLMAAMISQEKGQFDAIRAVEILVKRGYADIQLLIVGSNGGRYVWALDKYIKGKGLGRNIKILPFQSDLNELHKRASYALTCSQNEALGRVTIEAMLGGNLVIGADSGGTTEIIGKDESRGFLYELHNSEALADTIIRALQCSDESKYEMMTEAQKYAENTYDSRRYSNKILEVYNDVLASFQIKDNKAFLIELQKKYEALRDREVQKNRSMHNRTLKAETAFSLAVQWLEIRQGGHSLAEYFKKYNFKSVAIYGMADLGCRLYDELENADIEIRYLLDRNSEDIEKVLHFTSMEQEKLEVDVIVVTVAAAEKEVVDEIKLYGYDNVVGLQDILNDMSVG